MSRTSKTVAALIITAVVIATLPLLLIKDSEFSGADSKAEEAIAELAPEYKPWAQSLIEPPGGETESLLFSLQAGIGAGVIGFGFGYLVSRKKYKPAPEGHI